MKKNYYFLLIFVLFLSLFTACTDNDDNYIPIADAPIATDDTVSSSLAEPVVIPVLANDTTGGIASPTTVSIINGVDTDSNGTLDQLVVPNQGTWNVNPTTGEITFTPSLTYTGTSIQISYTVDNADGLTSNEAVVTINIMVNGDLSAVPFSKLSDYHFFTGNIKDLIPAADVIPYEPASSLFTDYALKKRFIWMPAGVKATYVADNKALDFPTGTILIKNFYYNTIQPGNTTKIIETRLMVKRADRWYFYEYIWNDAQTEANLVAGADFENGDIQTFDFKKPNGEIITEEYRIPSESECYACHKINDIRMPIGIKPQNINFNLAYNSGTQNQLQKLVEQGYLQSYPSNIVSTVDYHDTTKPLDLRFRSYIDANCAHCHQDQGRCAYRDLRLGFGDTNISANLGICITADEPISPTLQRLISPGNYSKSVLHYRLNTNDESERMPLLGRSIIHDEGIELVQQYISSLTDCN